MPSALFQPLQMRSLTLPNRVVLSPMCQYSAVDGCATDWHIIHLGQYVVSGAGLLIIEATAVEPAGRITPDCLGLWSDANEAALRRVLDTVRPYASMPIGLQLSHAGRKASVRKPRDGRGGVPITKGGWETVGPTGDAFGPGWEPPRALDETGMERIVAAHACATQRADRAGVDLLELHAGHGYLLSSFLSPLANTRADRHGGDRQGRMRFPLAVFDAMRQHWPRHKPLGVRYNATDWLEGGLDVEDAVAFAAALKERGCDYVDISSGGNGPAEIPLGPGYQVPFAEEVKRATGLTTMAVGLIRDPQHAEAIVAGGSADLVALGRGLLYEPRWVWHAAEALGATASVPHQYMRGATRAGLPSQDTIVRPH